nr:DUF84 family protein [Vibrio parahaemolyticus]
MRCPHGRSSAASDVCKGQFCLLTQNQLTRSSVYHQALILARIPFTNPDHFPANL